MTNNKTIGKRIKEARADKKITQDELAKALGMNKSTIQRYETAKIEKIKIPVIDAIARYLDVSFDWITGKTDEKGFYDSGHNDEDEDDPALIALKIAEGLPKLSPKVIAELKKMLDAMISE